MKLLLLFLFFSAPLLAKETIKDEYVEDNTLDWSMTTVFFFQGELGDEENEIALRMRNYKPSDGVLKIAINSLGGQVAVANNVLVAMEEQKKRGNKVYCAILSIAASAAAYLTSGCDRIYFDERSWMMWHKVSISDSIATSIREAMPNFTQFDLLSIGEEIAKNEAILDALTINAFGFKIEEYQKAKKEEIMWPQEMLVAKNPKKFITIHGVALSDKHFMYYLPIKMNGNFLPEMSKDFRMFLRYLSKGKREPLPIKKASYSKGMPSTSPPN